MKLVECVPNFSEGRDRAIIDQIAAAINSVDGSQVVDIDMGEDTNRTVVTFFGSPESAAESAFLAVKKAAELIDMSKHKGAHPRMGATDVLPFIPVSGVTMDDCVAISKKVGQRIGEWFEEGTASPATDADRLREERLAILRMVEQGKISVTEAEGLLRAIGE